MVPPSRLVPVRLIGDTVAGWAGHFRTTTTSGTGYPHLVPLIGPASLDTVVDVINGWSRRVRREAGGDDDPYPDPPEVEINGASPVGAMPTNDRLAEVADRLHRVFASTIEDRLAVLNGLIQELSPTPALSPEGPRWRIDRDERVLEGSLVFALAEHARRDPTLGRLGTCEAHACVDVYVDASQARTRRYCSVTCQNRVKSAAYRRRHR